MATATLTTRPPASNAAEDDLRLFALCDEHRRQSARLWALDVVPGDHEVAMDVLQAQMMALADRIEATRAQSFEALKAKADVLADIYGAESVSFGPEPDHRTTDYRLVYSLLADLGVSV